ncbi:ATP-binding protein [Chloroflexota bacterium]
MAKKKPYSFRDIFIDIAADAMKGITNPGIQRLSQEASKKFGVNGLSPKQLMADKQEQLRLKKLEMENQMYAHKLSEKEIEIEEKRRLLEKVEAEKVVLELPKPEMVIEGALTIPLDHGGIEFPDENEGFLELIQSLPFGKVMLILGRRGSGKTALAAKFCEYISATFGLAIYWVGLPEEARNLLPVWIKLVNGPEQVPPGSVILIDEAGIRYACLAFNTSENQFLRSLLMITRHRNSSLVAAVQSSRDVENAVVRQADTIIFKEPSLNQAVTERQVIRPRAKKAAEVFQQIPKEKRASSAMVFDDSFTGLITTTVPSFWSEELSHIYRYADLGQMAARAKKGVELDRIVRDETKLLEVDSLDRKILKLRSEGHGIEKTAKFLGISIYRVRKCLGI